MLFIFILIFLLSIIQDTNIRLGWAKIKSLAICPKEFIEIKSEI